jgi:hypothetical protein
MAEAAPPFHPQLPPEDAARPGGHRSCARGARTAGCVRACTACRTRTLSTGRSCAGALRTLYPAGKAFKQGYLKVSDIHEVYYEVWGNPDGKPAVVLHGGPGAGCYPKHS